MKRHFFAFALAALILVSIPTTAMAADCRSPYELPYDIETGAMFECASSSVLGNGRNRESLGFGKLHAEDPLIGYPKGYAYTETYQTCAIVRAKCDVNNNGLSTSSTNWREMNNTTACNSGTITASSAKCIFNSFHEARLTSTSNLFACENQKSFD